MVISVPYNKLSSKQKRAIIAKNKKLYLKANKTQKSIILDELQKTIGLSRKYIIYLLAKHKKKVRIKDKSVEVDITKVSTHFRGRKRKYPPYLGKILFTISYKIAGIMSSKHLKAFIMENYDTLWNYPQLKNVSQKDRQLIKEISPATIDRLTKPYREKYKLQSLATPFAKKKKKAAHLVKGQIDVEIWKEKNPKSPGYLEVDLVEHNGGNSGGEFLYTLTAVDVKTYWVFIKPLRNKARVWTTQAMEEILKTAPFKLFHLHSDNGAEFINSHLLEFCKTNNITFTRSRVHISNDNPHVENRNLMAVRRYVGYARYDTEEELEILKKLYYYIELRHNFFIPVMRLVGKEKKGKRYLRKYEIKTPYARLMEDPTTPQKTKENLHRMKQSLDILTINREIVKLYNKLEIIHNRKRREKDE